VSGYNSRIIELKRSEKAYKQLMTSLSHDVRTPLTSLIGYLDAIHNKVVEGAEKDGYLEIARNKAYNLKDFIDRLFEWFKLDSKERSFYFESLDINELTRSILADWIPIFEKNSITFHVDIPETECNILLDINAYTRMINNIIQNSLDHSGGNQIDISIMQKSDTAVINIFDNGKGIAEKEIPFIFDRLYKCDKSRSHKGSGLGLFIVKELAAAHHGTISAASISDEKTTFTITLPMEKVP
jgi:signal transduction histidine kinase